MAPHLEVSFVDPSSPSHVLKRWTELAEAHRQPMSSPGWMLAWLRNLAPARARPAIVAVMDRGRLVGLAPFFASTYGGSSCYRMLSGIDGRTSVLIEAGYEWEVATAIAQALASESPPIGLLRLERTATVSSLAPLLSAVRAVHHASAIVYRSAITSPVARLPSSFDRWFAQRSSNYRSEMSRLRRRFASAGGSSRLSTTETLSRDIDTFLRLHQARWSKGESDIAAAMERYQAALCESAAAMPDGWLRVHVSEIDGEIVSVHVFFTAGGEVLYYNGGWDARYARFKPGIIGILNAIEYACGAGDERVDFGPGAYSYKSRAANADDPLVSVDVIVPRPRLILRTAGREARRLAAIGLCRAGVDLQRTAHGNALGSQNVRGTLES